MIIKGDDRDKSSKNDQRGIKVSSNYVKWFSELSYNDVNIAGGKGANLGEMYQNKFPVPPGFVIISSAYTKFLEITHLDKKIYELLSRLNLDDTKELEEEAKRIQQMIMREEMPREMIEEIVESYEHLNVDKESLKGASADALAILKKGREGAFVAVRSSATAEDGAEASFAGQQSTFLNVKGNTKLIEAIKGCWASLFTARSVYYRIKKGFKHEETAIAVVVQIMVNPEKSGVMFTKDPVKNTNNVVIESVFGLGEGIVSGMINPDHYEVNEKLEIINTRLSTKKIAIIRNSSGENETVPLTQERGEQQSLTNYEIKKLAQYGLELEEHYKRPQDIEFAIDAHQIFIVQTRPITTLAKREDYEKRAKENQVEGQAILTGISASPGMGSGSVRIVHSLEELSKVKKGDVLVTEMTNPDMVVAMQRASAILTDEGGLTCFAGDTKILTNKGFITMQNAKNLFLSGEELVIFSYDKNENKPVWKRVINAGSRKRQAINVSVSQTGRMIHNTISITPDHKMFTLRGRDIIKKELQKVMSEGEMLSLVDTLPPTISSIDDNLAYLVGAIFTDGHIRVDKMRSTGNPRRGGVIFTQKETPEKREFIETVKRNFKEVFDEEFGLIREKYASSFINGRLVQGVATDHICSKLRPALVLQNIRQNFDKWCLNLSENASLSLLAGLIDGDGSFYNNRLHIYIGKEGLLPGVMIACLKLGIIPQITFNRGIHHVQILERMIDIISKCKRIRGTVYEKVLGNKLFPARQLLGDIIDKVNYKGRIRPYVDHNLLIDWQKISKNVVPMLNGKEKEELLKIINSPLRTQRVSFVNDLGEIEVYNLEVEADNELNKSYVVFTNKFTPLLVSNSHAAIVSREMGIPCVVGSKTATKVLKDGEVITIDGFTGRVYKGIVEGKKVEIKPVVKTKTHIKVIVDLPDYAHRAALTKCDAVGLTRLEGIIAEGGKHPQYFIKNDKLEEYEKIIYEGVKKIASYFSQVWVRTSDIRSDEYEHLEGAPDWHEANPMLGMHGIRASLKYPELLKAELKALRRVAEEGKKIGVMMPQIISPEEVRKTKEYMDEIGMHDNIELGIMVETPAAVQTINEMCDEGIKFISFGTNDLTQFTLALDRGNEAVQSMYNEMHPAIIRQIKHVIEVCKKRGVQSSICGQAGSRKEMAKILVEAGINSISVNADVAGELSVYIKELEEGMNTEDNRVEDEITDKESEDDEVVEDDMQEDREEEKSEEENDDSVKAQPIDDYSEYQVEIDDGEERADANDDEVIEEDNEEEIEEEKTIDKDDNNYEEEVIKELNEDEEESDGAKEESKEESKHQFMSIF